MSSPCFLVIGSNSFSGSHFVAEALASGFNVIGVSRSDQINNVFLPQYWVEESTNLPLANSSNYRFKAIDINKDLLDLIYTSHL